MSKAPASSTGVAGAAASHARSGSEIARTLVKPVVYGLNALWAVPAVLAMRAVRPWLQVRVGVLRHERIGHFVADAALYLADRHMPAQERRTLDLIWMQEPTANEQWARMVRRTFVSGWWVRYLISFNARIPGGAAHELTSTDYTRDIRGRLQASPARFAFTPGEEEGAKRWLRARGWTDGEPFVCLLVRDSAYLSSHELHSGGDWTYHDYRDSDIHTYVDAAQALVDRGYWVVRMGKVMHERFPLAHPRVIDYPFVADQDDLLDIWLSANCAIFISTGTGVDALALVYHRPIVFVNFNPFANIYSYARNVCVPKHLIWKATGAALTLREHCSAGYLFRSADYEHAGIVLRDLTSAEITAAVLECEGRLSGAWKESPEDRERQDRFWASLREWPEYAGHHGYLHPEARVGRDWLNSAGEGFFE